MANYYNEFDPYAAAWLRNLIAAGHLPPGDVDERSIVDVRPDDLASYTQCHFFAGIGGWSLAARLAGWPDDRELWTGSCPCQPFSVAGAQKGQSDERHLWPVFFRLIEARRPAVVMGEQVAAAVGKDWLDGVCVDLEGCGYAVGAAIVPACAVDAPHRRDRLWFVADASDDRAGVSMGRLQNVDGSPWTPGQRAYDKITSRVCQLGLSHMVRALQLWPTPTAITDTGGAALCKWGGTASREKLRGAVGSTVLNGALNPAWVCWLMGFPAAWDACAPTVTPLSRKSPPK